MTTPTEQLPTPPPAQVAPAAPRRLSPVLMIVLAVVGVVVLGLVFLFIGRATAGGGGNEAPAVNEPSGNVLTPLPSQPQPSVQPIPTGGSAPAPIPAPTSPPPMPAPTTAVPIPAPTSAEPVPAPTSEAPAPPPASADLVDIGNGIAAGVPEGWQVSAVEDGGVYLGTDGAGVLVYPYTAKSGSTGTGLTMFYTEKKLAPNMPDLQITEPEAISVDSPSITSAGRMQYRGTWVSQQGSSSVEGILFGFIRGDGQAILVDAFSLGREIKDGEFTTILVPILQTM